MQNKQFKMMYDRLTTNIYDNEIQCAGYLWLSLTEIQLSKIRKLAIAKGIAPDENGVVKIGAWLLKE
jgi:hypothetical protein